MGKSNVTEEKWEAHVHVRKSTVVGFMALAYLLVCGLAAMATLGYSSRLEIVVPGYKWLVLTSSLGGVCMTIYALRYE